MISALKVLHVIPSVSELSGGPAQAIFPMCRALAAQGVDVSIATTDHGLTETLSGKSGGPNPVLYKGTPTYFFPVQLGDGFKYSRPLAGWLNYSVSNFDVVHIHAVFNHSSVTAARSCRKHGVPYVVRPLGTLDPWSLQQKGFKKKLFWALAAEAMLQGASAIHYTARAEQKAVEQSLGLSRGTVVPLGIDQENSSNHSHTKATVTNSPYVLALSRLHPKKGVDVLIKAFLALHKSNRFHEWRLVIAGDGESDYVDALKQIVADSRADDLILFCGWLRDSEKQEVLRNASLLALPSRQENFGLCVLEALSHGVPVIVSPGVNVAADVVSAGAGWLSMVDTNALENTLAQALASEEERLRRGMVGKKFSEDFQWPRIAEQLEKMYASVIDNVRPKACV